MYKQSIEIWYFCLMFQIYLLVAPPNRVTMALFRVHVHCLNGATIALIFPVVNTRLVSTLKEII